MCVLSHGFLLSSYKAFFNLHTWVFLSFVLTSSGCKCLFVVYSFFPWIFPFIPRCFHLLHVGSCRSIWKTLRSSLQVSIPHPIHYSSWTGTLLPFLLRYFFIAGRFYINDVAQQCHMTTLCLRTLSLFESISILFFILYFFSNCHHLYSGTSLIIIFL